MNSVLAARRKFRELIGSKVDASCGIGLYETGKRMSMMTYQKVHGTLELTDIGFGKDAEIINIEILHLESGKSYQLSGPRVCAMIDWFRVPTLSPPYWA